MKLRNKAILGASVLLGGSVLLYATVNQIMNETNNTKQETVTIDVPVQNGKVEQPLTADIQTEKSILEQKRKEREKQVEQQERNAEKYLSEQQRIEAEALARSRAENQLYVKEEEIARPVVTPRPRTNPVVQNSDSTTDAEKKTTEKPKFVIVEPKKPQNETTTAPKVVQKPKNVEKEPVKAQKIDKTAEEPVAKKEQKPAQLQAKKLEKEKTKEKEVEKQIRPTHYQVQRGEGLIQLSRRYNVPVEVLAKVNGLDKNSTLNIGQKIVIPNEKQIKQSQKQIIQEQQKQAEQAQAKQKELAKKQQEIAEKKQQTEKYKNAEQKLKEARQEAKQTNAKGNFGVQIALATDQQKADEIVKRLQSAGYQAKTSQTTRGVRIVVGPEKGKKAALALKDKINADPKVKTDEAWVLFW